MTFWQELPKPFSVLAPMEDVTDVVFRQVVAKAYRPNVFFTEFINTASFCSDKGNFSTLGRLIHAETEAPLVAQIWGTIPSNYATMASQLAQMGFTGVDINMGCPAKKVFKIGAGSGMIGNSELASEVVAATKTSGLPVSVKTRLGRTNLSEMKPWLTSLLKLDLANLTIHLRTKREMSKVAAHYEVIPDIIALRDSLAPQTTITINGDINDAQHAKEIIEKYRGVDGYMIGRGVFNNLFCFEKQASDHNQSESIELFRYHLDQYDQYQYISPVDYPDLTRNFDALKHFFKVYISGFDAAAKIRTELYECKNTDEVRRVLDKYFD